MLKVREEVSQVKNLAGSAHRNKGQWTVDTRTGRVFEQDVLNPGIISGVAAVKQKY